jgi:hypothetical protein
MKKFLKSIATYLASNYIHFDVALTEKYALEVALLHPVRSLRDGLTVLEFKLNSDLYKGDHCPRHELELMIFNVMVLEIRIYNRFHEED